MNDSVLLVDSSPAYRNKVAERLRAAGLHVVEAGDPAAAEDALAAESFAVAVLDGGLDGRLCEDLIRSLRRRHADTRLVLIAGCDGERGDPDALRVELGVDLIVPGPAHPEDLTRVAAAFLGVASRLPPATRSSSIPAPRVPSASPGSRSSLPPGFSARGEDAAKRLREVRSAYREKLPGELDRLGELAARARAVPGDRALLRELHRLAHSIHGTAGTMGLPEASLAAGDIEREIGRGLSDGHPFSVDWEEIDAALVRARAAPERPSLPPEEPVRTAGLATVLVVDDDPGMLSTVELIARRNLIRVLSALGRDEALRLARGARLDGAVIDIFLADGENPFELAEALRSLEGHADLPIAFMSVDGSVPNRVAAVAAGGTRFIEKPLTTEELSDTVRDFTTARERFVPRVLIVDDDDDFRALVAAMLGGEGMDVAGLGDPHRVFDVLDDLRPDVLLLDVNMPGVDGFDVCRMLRTSHAWRELPILFLTGEDAATARIECYRAGGDDYLEKPVVREELLARIGVRVERVRLARERADRDALTGLPNRRAFLELFRLRLADARRDGRPLSLCLLDLDRFKEINDTRGHLAGDRVLAGLGRLLASRFRSTDIRARWGGEEFALAFHGEDRETARMVLGRVLDEFRRVRFTGDRGEAFEVTFSAGVATSPEDGDCFEDLFRAADRRLYRAKDEGRGRVL
jgi:diguanylate cyclase (GGDEF)-like protein